MAGFGQPGMGNWSSTSGPPSSAAAWNARYNSRFNQRFQQKYAAKHGGGAGSGSGGAPPPGSGSGSGSGSGTAPSGSGGAAAPTPGSPLDATYYNNIAANQFRANNQINALNLQGAQAGTALQQALGQLRYAQPRAALALEQRDNWGGHDINSTPYAQSQGDLANSFLDRQTAAQTRFGGTANSLAARIAAIQGEIPSFDTGQAIASAGRASRLAASMPAPPSVSSPATPAPATPAARLTRAQFNARFNQRYDNRLAARLGRGRRH